MCFLATRTPKGLNLDAQNGAGSMMSVIFIGVFFGNLAPG